MDAVKALRFWGSGFRVWRLGRLYGLWKAVVLSFLEKLVLRFGFSPRSRGPRGQPAVLCSRLDILTAMCTSNQLCEES